MAKFIKIGNLYLNIDSILAVKHNEKRNTIRISTSEMEPGESMSCSKEYTFLADSPEGRGLIAWLDSERYEVNGISEAMTTDVLTLLKEEEVPEQGITYQEFKTALGIEGY